MHLLWQYIHASGMCHLLSSHYCSCEYDLHSVWLNLHNHRLCRCSRQGLPGLCHTHDQLYQFSWRRSHQQCWCSNASACLQERSNHYLLYQQEYESSLCNTTLKSSCVREQAFCCCSHNHTLCMCSMKSNWDLCHRCVLQIQVCFPARIFHWYYYNNENVYHHCFPKYY